MNIGFTKMHGLGNDFIVIDNMNGRISLSTEQIVALCDRHKGIGADGVILIEPGDRADCFMNYYNSDGSQAEMCGNGVRCVAKFLKDNILKVNKSDFHTSIFKIDTRAGVKNIEYLEDGTFSVNMGQPVFSHKDFPNESLELEGLSLNFVSVGNPHAVALVEDVANYELALMGPHIENNSNFPNRINFHLVQKKDGENFKVLHWERGSGKTLACGTGACAVYAILRKYKNAPMELTLGLPGGEIFMSENNKGDIIMRGPATDVFSGMVEI